MKKILLLLICAGLTGCATTVKYEARLNTFVGLSEEQLIAAWGVPAKEYGLNDGKKAIEFARQTTIHRGGETHTQERTVTQTGTIGGKPYSGTSTQYVTENEPIEIYDLRCTTSFILNKDGKVESWHHEGNDCISY